MKPAQYPLSFLCCYYLTFFIPVADTLSMSEGAMEKAEHHPAQVRPRQQMIDYSIGHKTILEPTFDLTQPRNVTALIGKTAYLTCRVRHLGNKTVCFHTSIIHQIESLSYTIRVYT